MFGRIFLLARTIDRGAARSLLRASSNVDSRDFNQSPSAIAAALSRLRRASPWEDDHVFGFLPQSPGARQGRHLLYVLP